MFKVRNVSSLLEVVHFLGKYGSAIFRTFHACKCYLLMQIKQYTILSQSINIQQSRSSRCNVVSIKTLRCLNSSEKRKILLQIIAAQATTVRSRGSENGTRGQIFLQKLQCGGFVCVLCCSWHGHCAAFSAFSLLRKARQYASVDLQTKQCRLVISIPRLSF